MGKYYIRKAFTGRFVLMHWNFATFRYSQDKATVDAHGYAMIHVSVFCRYRFCISAWASALLVSTIPGNAKASMRETSDSAKVPRFFCADLSNLPIMF